MNGQKIELFVGDDASKPEQGKAAANKFISDGVKYVVGHFNSGVSIPTSTDYEEAGCCRSDRPPPIPPSPSVKLVEYLPQLRARRPAGRCGGRVHRQELQGQKVAIVHDKTPYGKGLADETQKAMNQGGVKEVIYEGINPGEKDYSALVSKLKAAGVDLVYYGGLHPEAGLLVRQMRDQGLNTVLFSGDGITDKEFWTIAGPGAAGTLMTFGPDPRKNPAAKEVVEKFKAKGIDPEGYVLYSYAAVQIMKQAMEATKSTDPKKLAGLHAFRRHVPDRSWPPLFRQEGRHHEEGLCGLRMEEWQLQRAVIFYVSEEGPRWKARAFSFKRTFYQ